MRTHAEIRLTHRISDGTTHDSRSLAATPKDIGTCQVLSLLAEVDNLRGTARVIWILDSVALQVVRAEYVRYAWLMRLELDLRAGHEVLELPLQVAYGFLSLDGRHGALRAVDFAGDRPPLRQNRVRLQLLTDHQDIHLSIGCRLIEILNVVDDAVLGHLITSLRGSLAATGLLVD